MAEQQPDRQPDRQPDWRTDTAERPRVGGAHRPPRAPLTPPAPRREARVPPDAGEAPPPARFPLYADEYLGLEATETYPSAVERPRVESQPDWFDEVAAVPDADQQDAGRRSPVLWLLVALAVLLVVAVVWWYFARADGSTGSAGELGQHPAGALAVLAGDAEMGH